ncbi:hypothetical protein [Streptomyces sp. NPDC002845]
MTDDFRCWLLAQGWASVTPADEHTDIEAVRGDERLIGEVKGKNKEKGGAVDIGYGQLLRRMTNESPSTRYALVVPPSLAWHAERVPAHIRRLLRIDLYEVADDGQVRQLPA